MPSDPPSLSGTPLSSNGGRLATTATAVCSFWLAAAKILWDTYDSLWLEVLCSYGKRIRQVRDQRLAIGHRGNSQKFTNVCRIANGSRIGSPMISLAELGRRVGFIFILNYLMLTFVEDVFGLSGSHKTCVQALCFGPCGSPGPRTRVLLERRSPSIKLWTKFVVTSPS